MNELWTGHVQSTTLSVCKIALSTISGDHTRFAPCLRANSRVGTDDTVRKRVRTLKACYARAPDLTIGASITPFLNESDVRWEILVRFAGLGSVGVGESRRRRDGSPVDVVESSGGGIEAMGFSETVSVLHLGSRKSKWITG